jgi:hypothetical protein
LLDWSYVSEGHHELEVQRECCNVSDEDAGETLVDNACGDGKANAFEGGEGLKQVLFVGKDLEQGAVP